MVSRSYQKCALGIVSVAQSCPALCRPTTVAHPAPLSMESSRQEYWSGLPLLSPGDLPDPEIDTKSPALQADSLLSKLAGEPSLGTESTAFSHLETSGGPQSSQWKRNGGHAGSSVRGDPHHSHLWGHCPGAQAGVITNQNKMRRRCIR